MSILGSTVSRASRSLPGSRLLSTSTSICAEAAPATQKYVRRAATARAPWKPATSKATPTSTRSAPNLTPPPAGSFPDDAFSSFEPAIDDYAHLAAAPSASVSPPLSSIPNETYDPLPDATVATGGGNGSGGSGFGAGVGIPGEASVKQEDWSTSFSGLSDKPFPKQVAEALLKPLTPEDVEIKPDGLLYLPEIKYRRTLNAAFGPGGWGLAPRGETHVGARIVSREWGLVCFGRLVSVARGEQEYFDQSGITTATEACKSNALMRCCKDLGIASELWDPSFIREFKKKHCVEVFAEHTTRKNKKKLWRKKNAEKFDYPWKET